MVIESETVTARRCWGFCDHAEVPHVLLCTGHCLCRLARPFSVQKHAPHAGLSPVVMPEEKEMVASDADGANVMHTAGHSGPTGLAMIAAAAEHASPFSSELRVPLSCQMTSSAAPPGRHPAAQ